jgi:FAD dependent oxidoreductase
VRLLLIAAAGSWTLGENAMAHAPSRRVVRSVSQSNPISKEGVSVWSARSKEPSTPALDENIHADVCIVGAGIAGMTTAYLLAREGKSVVILDKNKIGSGETANTTAHSAFRTMKGFNFSIACIYDI